VVGDGARQDLHPRRIQAAAPAWWLHHAGPGPGPERYPRPRGSLLRRGPSSPSAMQAVPPSPKAAAPLQPSAATQAILARRASLMRKPRLVVYGSLVQADLGGGITIMVWRWCCPAGTLGKKSFLILCRCRQWWPFLFALFPLRGVVVVSLATVGGSSGENLILACQMRR